MTEIMITDVVLVAWTKNAEGVKFVDDVIPADIFCLPTDKSFVGKTGADIGWTAFASALITADHRF